jgi:sugar (pentulose or hexulose) kinase
VSTAAGIVVNLGLKSVRAIAFDGNGNKLSSASVPVQTILRDLRIEQDADEWWRGSAHCLQRVTEAVGGDAKLVTVTASSACVVPVDAQGRPLRKAIMVSDRRASAEAAMVAAAPAFRELSDVNAGFSADASFVIPKILWIARNEPEIFKRTRWFLTPCDFLVHRLCGEAVTDTLNAEKFYWSEPHLGALNRLLDGFGIPLDSLPSVVPIGSGVGHVSSRAAADTGLKPGVRIHLSTYDAISAFWGSGVKEPGDVADVSGTVTSVRILSEKRLAKTESRIFEQQIPGVAETIVGGSNNLGGGLIEWLKQSFYPREELPYELMEHDARESGPSARGLLFLPYLLGERCPVWDTTARGVLFGLERQHVRGDVARAVFESAAFGVHHILSVIRSHGIDVQRLRVSGGLARIELINSIKADITGVPVEVVEEFETTALGAFLLAGVGAGVFSSLQEGLRIPRVREIVFPNMERHARYQEWFNLYLELYRSLQPVFQARQRLYELHGLGGVDRLENL